MDGIEKGIQLGRMVPSSGLSFSGSKIFYNHLLN